VRFATAPAQAIVVKRKGASMLRRPNIVFSPEDRNVFLEQLQRALNSRITIEQAKGALAQIHATHPDAAFEMLRNYSRRHHFRLSDVALAVLQDPASHPNLTTPVH